MSDTARPMRRTRQRAAVDDALQAQQEFRTAQQIHDQLRHDGQSVGLTTVYRTLQGMAEAGEVDVIRSTEGEASYRQCVSDNHHHHLVCRNCGRTVEITEPDVEAWTRTVAQQHGFSDASHELEIFGLCMDCG